MKMVKLKDCMFFLEDFKSLQLMKIDAVPPKEIVSIGLKDGTSVKTEEKFEFVSNLIMKDYEKVK